MRFAFKRIFKRAPTPERLSVEIAGRTVAVAVKRNARARRLILRMDAATGAPALTLPARASLAQAERFLEKSLGWLEARLGRAPAHTPFGDGAVFPLRGAPCRIDHRGGCGLVRLSLEGDEWRLSVPGDAAHLPRRVANCLKREARHDLATAAARHAEALGKRPAAIRIGDARSRWGSCSARGVLAFSWRLVLAPPFVLDYLAAHEAAHLVEMNHGPRFWTLVERLIPQHRRARAWLKAHGPALHAIGRSP